MKSWIWARKALHFRHKEPTWTELNDAPLEIGREWDAAVDEWVQELERDWRARHRSDPA